MIETYSHEKHFELIKDWNDARGQVGLEPWMLPEVGWVIGLQAAVFLVPINPQMTWLANWVVAPKISSADRGILLKRLFDAVEIEVRRKGFRILQTLGKAGHNMGRRLSFYGFVTAPGYYEFFAKNIGA